MSREVRAVLAHIVEKDDVTYRVQFATGECRWIPGDELDTDENRGWLVQYWRTQDNPLVSCATQTDAIMGFSLENVMDGMFAPECNFVEFTPQEFTHRTESSIPVEILSIDVVREMAVVKYGRDMVPQEMRLRELRDLAPVLVGEFLLGP